MLGDIKGHAFFEPHLAWSHPEVEGGLIHIDDLSLLSHEDAGQVAAELLLLTENESSLSSLGIVEQRRLLEVDSESKVVSTKGLFTKSREIPQLLQLLSSLTQA